ncbi:labile enterotoxin output A [Lysobacteraceae bacterium NML120232]|nr:labile enterotoxin output A [Xanthomonadaceae bacterium NML120232]PJK11042.1 labile enterotoxin output A [Xanthomonadaceae bacterium NML08-0793]
MSHVVIEFKEQKEKAAAIQARLLEFLEQGEKAGVVIDPSLKEKLNHSLAGSDKLKVALIGGFSEGKTSIAAAWLGRKRDDMKISQEESSNEVVVYQIDDELTLVDTPGLYGYKEKHSADGETTEKYKDITRKYVSEAHLVLYVMNSENPVKASHAEELNWLFRELNLLPRTVFVLSRFDKVADVEDEDDYSHHLSIKKKNVTSRLEETLRLSTDEVKALSIVAVSANPWDKGIDYWVSNPEEFKRLSHMSVLQDATVGKIRSEGGLEKMTLAAGKSIILDVLVPKIYEAEGKLKEANDEVERLGKAVDRTRLDMVEAKQEIEKAKAAMSNFVAQHFADVILQVRGASLETIAEVFERQIGSDGVVLNAYIQKGLTERSAAMSGELVRIQTSLREDVTVFNDHMLSMGRQGLDWLAKSQIINANTIKAARDIFWSSFKFKPWGAVNLAKGINSALPIVGLALDAWSTYKDIEKREAFEKGKLEIISNLEQQRRELVGRLESEAFEGDFFPGFQGLLGGLEELQREYEGKLGQQNAFKEWRDQAKVIEGEFRQLTS